MVTVQKIFIANTGADAIMLRFSHCTQTQFSHEMKQLKCQYKHLRQLPPLNKRPPY